MREEKSGRSRPVSAPARRELWSFFGRYERRRGAAGWRAGVDFPAVIRGSVLHKRRSNMRRQERVMQPSLLTRAVDSVFRFVRLAEFEILFVLFFVIAFLLFKDLTSRPDYNQILSKKRLEEVTGGFY